ncbi:hypothetical protein JW960_01510, partial [candidate division KSB1 bacterium]|nr:hypothetical protein [candidate division KSB1 bacterium]
IFQLNRCLSLPSRTGVPFRCIGTRTVSKAGSGLGSEHKYLSYLHNHLIKYIKKTNEDSAVTTKQQNTFQVECLAF